MLNVNGLITKAGCFVLGGTRAAVARSVNLFKSIGYFSGNTR